MQHPLESGPGERSEPLRAPAGSFVARLWRNLAAQDFLIGIYFALMLFAVLTAKGPGAAESIRTVLIDTRYRTHALFFC